MKQDMDARIAPETLEKASNCLRILAHPVRLRMVELLGEHRYTVSELAEACDIRQNVASDHLRLLEHCGMLTRTREGRRIYYQPAHSCLENILNCIRSHFEE